MNSACKFAHYLERVLYFLYNCDKMAQTKLSGTKVIAQLKPFKYREETLTEAILSLGNRKFPGLDVRAFSTHRESSISGADLLLVVKSKGVNVSLLMQSKRPDSPITAMVGPWNFDLGSQIPKGKTTSHYAAQRALLLKHAPVLKAVPVYGFYCPDKSKSSCNNKPGWDADFGTLHIVKVSTISAPNFMPNTPMPGVTLSNLFCCPGLTREFITDFQSAGLTEEEIVKIVTDLAENGEAPANIVIINVNEAIS